MTLYRIGVNSSTAIEIYPSYDFKENKQQLASEHRNKNGTYKKYIWGHYTAFNFTLDYVPSSDTNLINEWYDNNTILTLFKSATAVFSNEIEYSGLIMTNKDTPLSRYSPPYDTLNKGELLLEGGFS